MSEYTVKLRSNYLDGITDINIIMPNPFVGHDPKRFYESGKRYPVLWLLHGCQGETDDWFTDTLVPRLGIFRNTILVAPEAQVGEYMNQPHIGEGYAYTDFFFNELMPFLYNWFPASDAPEDNFIAGCSMGADAVWRYGILHPERFGAIAPLDRAPLDYSYLEPYRDFDSDTFRQLAMTGKIRRADGPENAPMRLREINTICKYHHVGEFLDSIENTMPRFCEAAKEHRLPKVYIAGSSENLADFETYTKEQNLSEITFNLDQEPAEGATFEEYAIEQFMDFAGLEEVESRQSGLPILCGVHDLDDDVGITIH